MPGVQQGIAMVANAEHPLPASFADTPIVEDACNTFCLVDVSHSRLPGLLETSHLLAAMKRASELLLSILYRLPFNTRVTVVYVCKRSFLVHVSPSRLSELLEAMSFLHHSKPNF